MLSSFAGSGIPASQDQAIVLTAAYHEIVYRLFGAAAEECVRGSIRSPATQIVSI